VKIQAEEPALVARIFTGETLSQPRISPRKFNELWSSLDYFSEFLGFPQLFTRISFELVAFLAGLEGFLGCVPQRTSYFSLPPSPFLLLFPSKISFSIKIRGILLSISRTRGLSPARFALICAWSLSPPCTLFGFLPSQCPRVFPSMRFSLGSLPIGRSLKTGLI